MTIRTFEDFTPRIARSAFVDEHALVIGDVIIDDDASIWPMTVVRGDISPIRIGARTNIQDGSVLHVTHDSEFAPGGFSCSVGADVTVGHKAILHACVVEDSCLIGMGATVMDGAVVRSGAIVAAGALVTPGKDLEGGYLWVGAPARRGRALTNKEQAFLNYSVKHYIELKNRHMAASNVIGMHE